MNNLEIDSKLKELKTKTQFIHSYNKGILNDYNLYAINTVQNNHAIRLALKEYDRIIMSCNKLKAVLEGFISNVSRVGLKLHYSLKNIISEDEWVNVEEKVLAHLQFLSPNIEKDYTLKSLKSEIHDVDLYKLMSELKKNKTSRRRKTSLDNLLYKKLKRLEKYYLYLIDKIALTACRVLYVKTCAEILNDMYVTISEEEIKTTDTLCDKYRCEIYNELKSENRPMVKYYAYQLLSVAEIATSHHVNNIIHIQEIIKEITDENTKAELQKQELEENKIIKERICDYAVGLYYHSAPPGILIKESRYASKLQYKVPGHEVDLLPLKTLLGDTAAYINKRVKVRGIVTSIKEKKWFPGGGEAVRSEFEISDNGNVIDVYVHGRMLRDNGLEKGCLIEISGIFEEEGDDNEYRIKITRFKQSADKNIDWVRRCRWLVRRWWDNGTDNIACDWTFTKKDHGAKTNKRIRREFIKIVELNNDLESRIKKEKKDYPLVRAVLAADKKIIEDTRKKRLNDNIEQEYLDAIKLIQFYDICMNK
jgi:hypothetical protein